MRREDGSASRGVQNGGFDQALYDYIDRLNAGEILDKERIRQEQPDYAEALIEKLQVFEGMGAGLEQPLGTLGDYTLRRQLGRGGMGVVYDAWENSLDRRVALKVLPPGVAADARSSTRFFREAQIVAKLSHPQIVPVHATGIKDGTPWYAMEYVEGETLAQVLAKVTATDEEAETPFGPANRQDFFIRLGAAFAEVADGLQHAHSKKVIHRDIKPSNLILDGDGRLRILDFGLARFEGQEALTLSGDFVGTPLYMSPEQARRKKVSVDHRTDVYSLGATMYESVTGRPPFRGKDHADTLSQIIERDPVEPRKVNSRVPKDLETIVLKCLRKKTADRYGTAEALAQDLRRFVRGDPVEARPETRLERAARWMGRRRWALATAGAVLVFVAAMLALLGRNATVERELERRDREQAARDYEDELLREVMKLERARLLLAEADPYVLREDRQRWTGGVTLPATRRARRILEEARDELEKLSYQLPGRPEAYYFLFAAQRSLLEEAAARKTAERARRAFPEFDPFAVFDAELAGDPGAASAIAGEREAWEAAWIAARRATAQENWEDAAAAYGKLLDIVASKGEPYSSAAVEFRMGRALAWMRTGDYDWAILEFARVQAISRPIEPALLLGKAFYRRGDSKNAERIFEELHARVSGEHREEVARLVSDMYSSLGDGERSLAWARRASENDYLTERSATLFFQGRFRAGADAARQVLRSSPEDFRALLFFGYCLLGHVEGRAGPAREAEVAELFTTARRAVELYPAELQFHSLLAWAHLMRGDHDRALAAAEEAWGQTTSANRGGRIALLALAAVYRARGDLDRAEAYARRILSMKWSGPSSCSSTRLLALILRDIGETGEGRMVLEEAFARGCGERDARFHGVFAGLLIEDGRLEEALQVCEKAASLHPRNSPVAENHAEALRRLGRLDEALTAVDQALAAVSDRPPLHHARGRILDDLGQPEEARRSFESALRLDPSLCELRNHPGGLAPDRE